MKSVLFLSALDFKEKSIQVLRKTPEAYAAAAWDVRYIVARDTSHRGNYSYEDEINPKGVQIERFSWPLAGARNAAKGRWPLYFWTRLAGFWVIVQLARRGAHALRQKPVDVVYGYEVHGVLALRLLRLFRRSGKAKSVTRFQGTWLTQILEQRRIAQLLANLDQIVALRTRSDLAIMTDDGTRGDRAMAMLRSPVADKLKFWVNGTDIFTNLAARDEFRARLGIGAATAMLLSVSRLEGWKRIDRGIAIAAALKRQGADFVYVIVGGGTEREKLETMAADLGVSDRIIFVGAVPQSDVFNYMNCADFFISMYDLSNVGNPLLEAIRMEKIVVTLNNGDTGSWIRHMENGLIYDPSHEVAEAAGRDIARLIHDEAAREMLCEGVRTLARERLWTWSERMTEEVTHVERLLES
ncbi:glycosyltransferase family 4 protein [Hyphomicrobium sp.]|uniref:glycosyltransferase family 4 protein n=1 Tax=Hyphomicrobium sp. TaxID=82 RepID=UPI002FE12D75